MKTISRMIQALHYGVRSWLRPFGVLAAAALPGCGELQPVAGYDPIIDPAQLYTSLTLNYGAVNLSTAPGYDTVRLVATPRNVLGMPMTVAASPTFTSCDTASVKV